VNKYDLVLAIILVVTLVIAWIAAAAETALTSVNRILLRRLAKNGSVAAQTIEKLHQEPNNYLTAILTANTTSIIVSATAAGMIANNHGVSQFFPQLIISLLDALVVLIFCEITAKSLALQKNMEFALFLAKPIDFITSVLKPLLLAMSFFSRLLTPVTKNSKGPFVTEEELKMIVTMGEQDGIIEEEEREMIHGVIEIGDMAVVEVMIPRIDMIAVEQKTSLNDVIDIMLGAERSRLPVYENTIDSIVGFISVEVLLKTLRLEKKTPLINLVQPVHFVPESKKLSEFLREMRTKNLPMAIVVDEFGQTAGLLTFKNVIEEIIGPINDEVGSEDFTYISETSVECDAKTLLVRLVELVKLPLEREQVNTIGGLIHFELGEIPKIDSKVTFDGLTLTVLTMKGQRIGKVRIDSDTAFSSRSEIE
jgi:CBS domain containing-hemolysin-like protein